MHSLRVSLFALLALAALLLPATATAQVALKVAVVDFQRALNEVEEGKKARTQLEAMFETTRLDLEKDKAEIEALGRSIEEQQIMLSETALAAKKQEFQEKYVVYQQKAMESQQQMAMLEQELTADILMKLSNVASDVAKEQGYTLVIEATSVIHSEPSMDITDSVVTRFNSKGGK